MTIAETLAQLPYDYPVELRPKGGTVTYIDEAGVWLEDYTPDYLNSYFDLVTEVHLPDQAQNGDGPVDLHRLMSGEPLDEDWMVEPVLPRGKLVGFVSRRGEGKSLFALDLAANRAAGQPVLEQSHDKPVHVVYLDLEMGPEDLFDRLFSLGWTVNHPQFETLCEHLHYYQLITMPPLDTPAGGLALEELVDAHDADLVVIDTVSRVISGDENAAEPFRDLFRYTETRLKRRGVTLARLDHLGKDAERGSRGSSAKEDPLDVVWHVTQTTDDTLHLKLTKGRQDWVPRSVAIKRVYYNGVLTHEVPPQFAPDWLLALVDHMDRLDMDIDISGNEAYKTLQEAGTGSRRTRVLQAVKFRKQRLRVVPDSAEPPGTTPREPPTEPPGTTPQETLPELGEHNGNHPRNHPEPDTGVGFPPRRGNHPVPEDEDDLPDPW